ncbi:MAG: hypothetical protein R8N23_07025 [Reichenbachiella sp.]|uniref:hypothetical protein n=1 Tax=Reichenbachiella sp. TaxID=2184521 RepID=UPI0029675470|nr:hypothetical protein [Reichenbachiella sp.]MDW3209599.1 hypothetical protein [Reichenbachiella sp.]
MWIKKSLIRLLPFELKRGTSWLSIITALILTGVITKLGESILLVLVRLIRMGYEVFGDKLFELLSQTYEVSLASIIVGSIVFITFLFPIYRKIDRLVLAKIKKELIFKENFTNPTSWSLNYWGTKNPNKTNRIQDNKMIFEAAPEELIDPNNFFGACYDLKNGIFNGNKYEVSCQVAATKNATMKFQLWLHDTKGGNSSVKYPITPTIPTEEGETIGVKFIATETNAMRIHLHCQGGSGRITVNEVSVNKVK